MVDSSASNRSEMQGTAAHQAVSGVAGLEEWRQGGPLVLTTFVGGFLISAVTLALGALVFPLQAQFGWSRAQVSGANAIMTTITFLAMTFVGALVDRFGARRLTLLGLVLFPAALVLVGLSGPQLWTWAAAWVTVALAYQLITPPVWAVAVAGRFSASRGFALGVASCGLGVANAVVPLATVWTVQALGWRSVYFVLAGAILLVALPLALRFFYDASDLRRRTPPTDSAHHRVLAPGASFSRALLSPRYWQLAAIAAIVAAAVGFINLHMQPILRDAGLTAVQAASVASLYGPGALIGRLAGGWLLDRVKNGPSIVAAACLFPALAGFSLLHLDAHSAVTLWIPPIFAGLAAGLEIDFLAFLTAKYFGFRSFGRIYLSLGAFFVLVFGVSPFLGGVIFDRTHSYNTVLIGTMAAAPMAALLALMLGPYPDRFDEAP